MNISPEDKDVTTPVLIVGGGVVGLSAALFLAEQDIPALLIEKHSGTSIHPRARGFDTRTMELYRELGLSHALREAGKALAPAWGIFTAKSLAEGLKNKKPKKKKKAPDTMPGMSKIVAMSPEIGARCTQDLSEPVLLEALLAKGCDVMFHTEMISFTQNQNGVDAVIKNRDTGAMQTVHADYMIAADGAKSVVRESLHAATSGKGAIADLLNIYFEADLGEFVKGREFSIMLVNEPDIKGMLTSINNSNRWVFHLNYDSAKEKPKDFTEQRLLEILKRIVGLPDILIRIISVLPWQPTVKVVNEMMQGRIFLAGDAAHVMTPYGGKGANTGIQDVHNLAWKLAMVIQGTATIALLETYNMERQPIGLKNALQSGTLADENGLLKKNMLNFFGIISTMLRAGAADLLGLGRISQRLRMRSIVGMVGIPDYEYHSTAIIADGETKNAVTQCRKAAMLNGKPGTRMPHLWVEKNGSRISTLDLMGTEFVLFTGTNNEPWQKAVKRVQLDTGINISIFSIGEKADLAYQGDIKMDLEISDTGAVLVRPDGYVAWSQKEFADDENVLVKVIREILGMDSGYLTASHKICPLK